MTYSFFGVEVHNLLFSDSGQFVLAKSCMDWFSLRTRRAWPHGLLLAGAISKHSYSRQPLWHMNFVSFSLLEALRFLFESGVKVHPGAPWASRFL